MFAIWKGQQAEQLDSRQDTKGRFNCKQTSEGFPNNSSVPEMK